MGKKWIDIRQPFYNGMQIPKALGDLSIEYVNHKMHSHTGAMMDVSVTKYAMATHVGTHVDAEKHFFADGKTIDEYPIERFIGDGVVIDVRKEMAEQITKEDLEKNSSIIHEDDIVLLYTGWSEKFGSEEYHAHPYLSNEAAQWLVDKKIKLLGVDMITPDLPSPLRDHTFDHPVHQIILGNGILIMENIGPRIKEAIGKRVTVGCIPTKIVGADGAPTAAFILMED